jgi:hypothetical protein
MREQKFPPDWDEERVRQVLAHYEGQTEDEQLVEIEAARDADLIDRSTESHPSLRAPVEPAEASPREPLPAPPEI